MHIFKSLADGWAWKSALAALLPLIDKIIGLFSTDERLVLVVVVLFFIDLAAGVVRAIMDRRFSSFRLRGSVVKGFEYVILLACVQLFANAFPLVSWSATWAFFYVGLTELSSIFESVFGSKSKALEIWGIIKDALVERGPGIPRDRRRHYHGD